MTGDYLNPHYPRAANVVFTGTSMERLSLYERGSDSKSFAVLGFGDQMQQHRLLNTAMQIMTPQNSARDVLDTGEVIGFLDALRTGRDPVE